MNLFEFQKWYENLSIFKPVHNVLTYTGWAISEIERLKTENEQLRYQIDSKDAEITDLKNYIEVVTSGSPVRIGQNGGYQFR